LQGDIEIGHRYRQSQIGEAGHAMFADATWNYPAEMSQVRLDIDRESVKAYPFAQAYANGCDLDLGGPVVANGPDSGASLAPFAPDVEFFERGDRPVFKLGDETARIAPTRTHVQHRIDHALTRPMICIPPTAPGRMDRKPAGSDQFGRVGRCAGRIERGMFHQPDRLGGLTPSDPVDAALHCAHRAFVGRQAVRYDPVDG